MIGSPRTLVSRLRNAQQPSPFVCQEAADRIEALESDVRTLRAALTMFIDTPFGDSLMSIGQARQTGREALSATALTESDK